MSTEISMPAIAALPIPAEEDAGDEEDASSPDCAFTIINQDNLPPMAIIGESLLKPFGTGAAKTKPNGIVLPQRRITNNNNNNNTTGLLGGMLEQKPFAKSNGAINVLNERNGMQNGYHPQQQQQQQLRKQLSNSHGHLNHVKIRIEDLAAHGLDKNFTRNLDAKLRKLQREAGGQSPPNHGVRKIDASVKPRFVTTVKKGEFLEPPPELASLLGLLPFESKTGKEKEDGRDEKKHLYAYASQPRVLERTLVKYGHKARCDAAARAAAAVGGGKEEVLITKRDVNSNMVVPKRISDAQMPYQNLMFERRVVRGSNYAMQSNTGEGESAAARAAEARRRAIARKKSQSQQLRGAQLRLSSPPPVHGRRHEKQQTESYLEELAEHPQTSDETSQTDLFLDRPDSPLFVPAVIGVDAETQIWPGDLFDFDMEVQPILEVLVGKTIEQALIEVLEEEELAALREQQRRFMEAHASELAESMRLHELERRMEGEKARRLAEYEEGMRVQKEMEERIAGAVLMQGYMADLLPSVLEGLEDEGFLTDNIKQNIDDSFIPWLMKEVTSELKEMVSSRDLLTDIVREILENRAEIYRALNAEREESEEEHTLGQDIPLVEHMKLKEEIAEKQKQEIEQYLEH